VTDRHTSSLRQPGSNNAIQKNPPVNSKERKHSTQIVGLCVNTMSIEVSRASASTEAKPTALIRNRLL
jgi:hypothetical protein